MSQPATEASAQVLQSLQSNMMADGQSGLTEAEQKSGQCSKEPGYQEPDSKRLAETLQIHTTLQKLLEGELV